MKNISLYSPYVKESDIRAVSTSLRSLHLARGEEVGKFEYEFASFVGRKFALAVNSGSTALFLVLKSLELPKGSRIITSPFSYIATTNAILHNDLQPLFIDVSGKTLNLNFLKAQGKSLSNVSGVLLPHIFGATADLDDFQTFISSHPHLKVVEDACQALVPKNEQLPVGKFAQTSVYSLHENKIITAGEGGVIATDNFDTYSLCKSLRDQGRSSNSNWIENTLLGYNFRITEMQAALARSQLSHYWDTKKRLDYLAGKYIAHLSSVEGIGIPEYVEGRLWNFFYISVGSEKKRDYLKDELSKRGIVTASHYFPAIYRFKHVKDRISKVVESDYPQTEKSSKNILLLPFYSQLKGGEVDYVCKNLIDLIKVGNSK